MRKSLFLERLWVTVVCAVSCGATRFASAQEQSSIDATKKECVAAYERAQVTRESGNFLESRQALEICSRDVCHPALRTDCIQWHDDLRRSIPTVVVSAHAGEKDILNVRIFVDNVLVARRLDGRPLELNPGTHQFRFETPGYAPEERQLLLVPGEKLRALHITFTSPEAPAEPPSVGESAPPESTMPVVEPGPLAGAGSTSEETSSGLPPLGFVFGGLALVGLGTFAGLGLSGLEDYTALESSCKPTCTSSEVDPVRTKFLIADISLGVGLASAAAAAFIFLSRPSNESKDTEKAGLEPSFALDPVRESAAVTVRGRF